MTDGAGGWLTTEQQVVWRSWLRGVARIDKVLDEALRPNGLDLAEYEILVALSEAEEHRARMSDLADEVHQSRSRLTHTVGRMEARGLVTRERSTCDGRGVVARLTDEGMALLVAAAPTHVASVRKIFVDAVDPDDYEAVGRAMAAILAVNVDE